MELLFPKKGLSFVQIRVSKQKHAYVLKQFRRKLPWRVCIHNDYMCQGDLYSPTICLAFRVGYALCIEVHACFYG